ncbi:MAG: hypothetical protein AB1640_12755 [bacterium]
MRITLSRMILLSGLMHAGLVGAAATARFSASLPKPPPQACQVKLVKRADVPVPKLPKLKEEPPKKMPEPVVEKKKEAPVLEAKTKAPVEERKPDVPPVAREVVQVDMTLVMERPLAKREQKAPPAQPKETNFVPAADIDLSLDVPQPPRPAQAAGGSPRGSVKSPTAAQPNAGAGYVAMAMEIGAEKASRPGSGPGKSPGVSTGTSRLGLTAKAHAATLDDVGMTLDIQRGGGNGGNALYAGQGKSSKGTSKPGGVLSSGGTGLGGIEMPSGLLAGENTGRPAAAAAASGTHGQGTGTPGIMVRQAEGQIALGAPLPFKLADVGDETTSGSAYLSRSAQLKKFLEGRRLPSAPVTRSLEACGLAGLSYSSTQVVLQFANGKQQVITMLAGEPYPRFELRLASAGGQNVSVGTKLQEITVCLQTLQHVLKE